MISCGRGRFILALAVCILAFVLLSSCSGGGGERTSEIKSVRYQKADAEITVSATLDSADVREFRGETVYLIEVPANSDVSDITTLIPVAQSKSGAEMEFSLPLKDGARTLLYSGFVLAVFDNESGYIPLCDVKYVENPASLAVNTEPYPKYSSVKGLSIVSSSDAVALGAKHTVIRIAVEDFLLTESGDGSMSYIFDGTPYYFSSERIGELDYKIKNLSGAGIEVYLEFTLGTPAGELPPTLSELASRTAPDEGDTEEKTYDISVDTGNGYRYMAAFFEMLAERYTRTDGKYGFAGAYIIGRGVNSDADDPRTLGESVSRYAKLLRVASTALRSKYAEGKIFLSLDNVWNIPSGDESSENEINPAAPVAQRESFGGAEYLTALRKELEKGGSIDYGVALIPTASDNSSSVWNDIGAEMSEKTEFLTVKNLGVARTHIGEDKELIIYDYGISSSDETAMAASYAYAYLKTVEAGATAFIYNGQWDNSTGNGESGLWRSDSEGAYEKRAICEVFAAIDREEALMPDYVGARIGSEWNALYEKYGKDIKTETVTSGSGSTVKNEDDKALKKAEEAVLFDFSEGQSFDFFPSDSAQYVEISTYIGENVLKSGLQPKYKGENVGVRSAPIPFEKLEKLLMITAVLSADPGAGNTALVTLGLVQNGETRSVFHTSSVSVQASNRQTVYFDMRDAELDSSLGDVTLYLWVRNEGTRSPIYSGGEGEEQLLYIESITASVKKNGNPAVLIIIIVILLLILLAVLYILFVKNGKRTAAVGYPEIQPYVQRKARTPGGQRQPQRRPPQQVRQAPPPRQRPIGGQGRYPQQENRMNGKMPPRDR